MKAAFDEIMVTAIKRQHEPQRIIGDLLTAEINEKQARSIKYQLSIVKLPLAKDLDDFQFPASLRGFSLMLAYFRRRYVNLLRMAGFACHLYPETASKPHLSN